MSLNSRITRLAFILALLLLSTQAWALPSACPLRCQYPNTCYDQCITEDDIWTTCEAYLGGCGIDRTAFLPAAEVTFSALCPGETVENGGVSFDFLR